MDNQRRILFSSATLVVLFVIAATAMQTSKAQWDKVSLVYINHHGTTELKLPFSSGQPFSEGLAAVEENEKIGYIDKSGKCIIQPQFAVHKIYGNALGKDRCRPLALDPEFKFCSFSEGLAAVPLAWDKLHRWGYINHRGAVVIPASFQTAGEFHEGLAAVRTNGSIQFIDKRGKLVVSPKSIEQAIKDSKLVAPPPRGSSLYPQNIKYSQGLAPFAGDSGYFGYLDNKGDYVIKPEFINALPFHEGMACVCKGHWIVKTIKRLGKDVQDYYYISDGWFFINQKGNQLFGRTFEQADDFAEGLAPVKINERWGFINKKGQVVIKLQFDGAFPFSDGLACVQFGTKYGCINHQGVMIIKPIYNRKLQFKQGLAPIVELP